MSVLFTYTLPFDTAKVRWLEPYSSAALNQKTLGLQPKGVFAGFNVVPFGAFGISVQVDPVLGFSGANVVETTGGKYCVTLIQPTNVPIDLSTFFSTTVYIALDVQYAIGAATTSQIVVVSPAQLTDPLNADLVLLAKVNVPGVGPVTAGDINTGYRLASGDSITSESRPSINFLPNGTFERNPFPGVPAGWVSSGGGLVLSIDTVPHSGTRAMRLDAAGVVSLNATSQTMVTSPGLKHHVSCWIRSTGGTPIAGGTGVQIQIEWLNYLGVVFSTDNIEAPFTGGGTTYVERKAEVVAPGGANTARFKITYGGCSGTLFFDDAEFSTRSGDEAIADGGSSYAGGTNWADGTTNPATTIEGQLDKIILDLAGASGAPKIGNAPSKILNNTFTNGVVNTPSITAFGNGTGAGVVGISGNLGTGNNAGIKGFGSAIGAGGATIGVYAEGGTAIGGASSGIALVAVGGDGVSSDVIGGKGITVLGGTGGTGGNDGGVGITATGGDGGGGNDGATGGVFTGGAPNGAGGIFVGNGTGPAISASAGKVANVANPTSPQDATTKAYVDTNDSPNAIINGGFRWWERGNLGFFSGVTVAGYNLLGYRADRWYAQIRDDGIGGNPYAFDVRRITVQPPSTTNLRNTNTVARLWNQTAGFTGFAQLVQEIDRETVIRLRGKKVSFRVAVRAGTSNDILTDFFVECITGTNAGSNVKLSAYTGGLFVFSASASGAALSSSVFQYYTGTSTLPVDENATVMAFYVGAYHNGGGPGNVNDYMEFGEAQILEGDVPPHQFSWNAGDANDEKFICERYYEKSGTEGGSVPISGAGSREISVCLGSAAIGVGPAAGDPWIMRHPRFRTAKRRNPTVRIWTTSSVANQWDLPAGDGLTGGDPQDSSVGNFGPNGFEILNNTGGPYLSIGSGNAVGQWDADSEI